MFTNHSFEFLSELTVNNNKEWFLENKQTYDEFIINPLKDIISDLEIFIMSIDNSLETKPVINKAISRIYRDTRFSKNKLPFKNYIGFNFRKKCAEWKFYPSFIFRITPSGYIFGLTIMKNNPDFFLNFRNSIDDNKTTFANLIKNLNKNKNLELRGENYKKYAYKGKNKSVGQWYSKKNLYITCRRNKDYYASKADLIVDLQKNFQTLKAIYIYLDKISISNKAILRKDVFDVI
jgi:uncharacterized protein (TIGR02453 family)